MTVSVSLYVRCFSSSFWQQPKDSLGFRENQSRSQSSNAMVRKPFASSFSCSAGKGNQYLHWACQQMKTWSALKVSARLLLDNHEQHRQMTRHQKSSQFTETSWQRSLINWSHLGFFFNQRDRPFALTFTCMGDLEWPHLPQVWITN